MANPNDTPAPTKPQMAGCQQEPCSPSSDTPETDALSETMCRTAKMEKWRNLARKLERERNEALATSKVNFDIATGYHAKWQRTEKALDIAHASLREMIDLNETTGDPDPEITDRARALLPENTD